MLLSRSRSVFRPRLVHQIISPTPHMMTSLSFLSTTTRNFKSKSLLNLHKPSLSVVSSPNNHAIRTTASSSSSSSPSPTLHSFSSISASSISTTPIPLKKRELYSLFRLHKFDKEEIEAAVSKMCYSPPLNSDDEEEDKAKHNKSSIITRSGVMRYLSHDLDAYKKSEEDDVIADRFMASFRPGSSKLRSPQTSIPKTDVTVALNQMVTAIDVKAVMPISVSMLLIGSCVGMITPVMPLIVSNLGLNVSEFGYVVSAFGAAKLLGNIPAAILVERHGRKPYLVYSLIAVAAGTSGIGFASGLDQLILCRLAIGFGVAALSTSATLAVSDLSTPRNRASTMAPVMVAFSAGTALGPAVGGLLADTIGLESTFALVGVSFLANSVLNGYFLEETKRTPLVRTVAESEQDGTQTIPDAFRHAVGQWKPLLSMPPVRNAILLNTCYWVALSGAQMTMLPLLLTDPNGFAMTSSSLGQVYAGMSFVQVMFSQPLALVADRIGKQPMMITGCGLAGMAILTLTQATSTEMAVGSLGFWALGSAFLSTAPVAYVSDLVTDAQRAQAIALLRTCGDIGFLGGAIGTGALADLTSINSAMATSGSFLLLSTTWYFARSFMNIRSEREKWR